MALNGAPGDLPSLIGMIHLLPLPGSPGYSGDFGAVAQQAATDAATLASAGFDGLMIENFGDAPFFTDEVPPITVAAITRAADVVKRSIDLPLGINVLRNDARSALSIATAVDARFIRVNVLTGMMFTDQGPIVGKAAELVRLRQALDADVAIMADVFVKHAVPPPGLTLEEAAKELAGRGGADAVIVSGSATGDPPTAADLKEVRAAIGSVPLYVGSGADRATAAGFMEQADGLIVGSATKPDGTITAPVDIHLAAEIVDAATAGRH